MEMSPYQPLEEGQSRVMELLPGHKSAPLQCVLRPISLNTRPQYEALSYTWGEPFGVPYEMATAATAMTEDRRTGKLPVSTSGNVSPIPCAAFIDSMPELCRDSGESDDGSSVVFEVLATNPRC
jgi:hypothetical protein